jgi:flagellar hook-length control protein FliK
VTLATLAPASQLAPAPAPQQSAAPAKTQRAAQTQATVSASVAKTASGSASAPAKTDTAAADDASTDIAFAASNDDGAAGRPAASDQSASGPAGDDAQLASQNVFGGPPQAGAASVPAPSAPLPSAHGAEITAQLAAQITSRASAARAAFDFALEPQGLGRVDVSLKIDSQGQLSAVLSFDNPGAAAEAKGRAADLQQALQQAGLNVSQSALSFTSSGGQGHGAAWQGPGPTSYAQGPNIADSAASSSLAPSTSARNATGVGGLDITI